jgi:transposase
MSYFGLVPSERSSGGSVRHGGITKTGNNEVRRILIQSAWCYRYPARVSRYKADEFAASSSAVRQIAWKAQLRLTKRYRGLVIRKKPIQVVITAIARELLSFMWAIGQVEKPASA